MSPSRIFTLIALFCLAAPHLISAGPDPQGPTVYVFLSETCPVARYYTRTLRELHKKYADVRFVGVFPNRLSTHKTISAYKTKYRLSFHTVLDADQKLTRTLGATVTPEVIVTGPEGNSVYRGRIDNAFAQIGKRRRVITSHDLAGVLDGLQAGKPVKPTTTEAVGCFITFHTGGESVHDTH